MKKTIAIIVLSILSIASFSAVLSSSGWGERDDEERYERNDESGNHEHEFFRGPPAGLTSRCGPR